MDPITIIAIVIGLLIAGFLIFIENAFEKILNTILSLIGLNSSTGPLKVKISKRDQCLELAIENKGNTKARLADIEVIDGKGKKSFPLPFSNEEAAIRGEWWKRAKRKFEKHCYPIRLIQVLPRPFISLKRTSKDATWIP